uniref:Uncharacterized protein n=1 Tax=Lepeophtheirus salmonis TaxID=72036 RepID=A0A0K2VGJ7_LEPSM
MEVFLSLMNEDRSKNMKIRSKLSVFPSMVELKGCSIKYLINYNCFLHLMICLRIMSLLLFKKHDIL